MTVKPRAWATRSIEDSLASTLPLSISDRCWGDMLARPATTLRDCLRPFLRRRSEEGTKEFMGSEYLIAMGVYHAMV